ncbi:MAG: STAS domain-containing protein [Proteobacteria bacterium]|nr:STAS domain-containing protein [Pseudomonadota bacterium]
MTKEQELTWSEDGQELQVHGSINFKNVVRLRQEGQAWLAERAPEDSTVDLGAVTQSDNSGLVLLVSWFQDAKKYKKRLRFVNIPQFVQQMAQVFGLNTILFNIEQ